MRSLLCGYAAFLAIVSVAVFWWYARSAWRRARVMAEATPPGAPPRPDSPAEPLDPLWVSALGTLLAWVEDLKQRAAARQHAGRPGAHAIFALADRLEDVADALDAGEHEAPERIDVVDEAAEENAAILVNILDDLASELERGDFDRALLLESTDDAIGNLSVHLPLDGLAQALVDGLLFTHAPLVWLDGWVDGSSRDADQVRDAVEAHAELTERDVPVSMQVRIEAGTDGRIRVHFVNGTPAEVCGLIGWLRATDSRIALPTTEVACLAIGRAPYDLARGPTDGGRVLEADLATARLRSIGTTSTGLLDVPAGQTVHAFTVLVDAIPPDTQQGWD